jgi:hypothetical protein
MAQAYKVGFSLKKIVKSVKKAAVAPTKALVKATVVAPLKVIAHPVAAIKNPGLVVKTLVTNPLKASVNVVVAPVKQLPAFAKATSPSVKQINQMAIVAKVVGPGIALINPAAGAAITAAGILVQKATQGMVDAQNKAKAIKAAAEAPDATTEDLEKAAILNVAEVAQQTEQAQTLLQSAEVGNPNSLEKINDIRYGAAQGDPEAMKSLETLTNAATGLVAPKPGEPRGNFPVKSGPSKSMMIAGAAVAAAGVAYLVIRKK